MYIYIYSEGLRTNSVFSAVVLLCELITVANEELSPEYVQHGPKR